MFTGLLGNLSLLSYFAKKKEKEAVVVQTLGVISIYVVIAQLAMPWLKLCRSLISSPLLLSLPLVMWSTFVPYIPKSILPGITAFFLAVAAVVMEQHVTEQSENNDSGPFIMNAFEMITLSQGLNLSALFDRRQTRLEGMSVNKIGQFAVVLEVFEVAPFLFMVDVRKATGDTNEYHKFYKNFCAKLEHIIWKPKDGPAKSSA